MVHLCNVATFLHGAPGSPYYSQLSKKLEEMRVIFEPGDMPEWRNLMYNLQKCGMGVVIVEESTKHEHWLLSEDEIKAAILKVMPYFSVSSQWVAVYRVLVDFCGYPEELSAFCKKIARMMFGSQLRFAIDYQSLQKPLAANGILQKSYNQWQEYVPQKGDRFFARQKMIAEKLLKALGIL